MNIGYARVSTVDQKLDAQIDALKAVGCKTIYNEKVSGKTIDRPQLKRLLEQIRPGEILTVTALDRLARSALDLHAILKELKEKEEILKQVMC